MIINRVMVEGVVENKDEFEKKEDTSVISTSGRKTVRKNIKRKRKTNTTQQTRF